mgnify:CR=1 FL=1
MSPGEVVEIHGLSFTLTADGTLSVAEVRERVAALAAENARLREQCGHVEALRRLAEATVIQASELAREIEAEARARADAMLRACEEEIAERRRQLAVQHAAEVEALQARARQLQEALDAATRTLAEGLQAVSGALPTVTALVGNANAASTEEERPSDASERPPGSGAIGAAAWGDASEATATGADQPQATDAVPQVEPSPVAREATEPFAETGLPAPEEAASQSPAVDLWAEATELSEDARIRAERLAAIDAALAEIEAEPAPGAPVPETDITEKTPALEAQPLAASAVAAQQDSRTIEVEMRPVRSFAELTHVTKVLGEIAPGAQPVDLSLALERALFAVQGHAPSELATQLRRGLPGAIVHEREGGLDVLLSSAEGQ